MEQKKLLRKLMQEKRSAMSLLLKKDYDYFICEALYEYIESNNINTIHTYLPMGDEINIIPLIEKLLSKNKTVIVPKALKKRRMMNLVLHSLNELEDGIYGTKHPATNKEFKGKYELFIIPGLAFDHEKYRLGYGAGYYDSFLTNQKESIKIGIAYPFQVIDKVPIEPHDVMLDMIITPN